MTTHVLVSITRTRGGFAFTVDGIARDGVERPAPLTVDEYAAVASRIPASVAIDRLRVGARRTATLACPRGGR